MKIIKFLRTHRILQHLLYILVVAMLLLISVQYIMDKYTQHGVSVVVPDIKRMTIEESEPILKRQGLAIEVIDSLYDANMRPGVIIEQTPREGTAIKQKKAIYVVINSITPRQVSFPELKDISYRQASSLLEGLGFPKPQIEYVQSIYKDLVVSVTHRGRTVKTGQKYPITAQFTLIVGMGADYVEDVETTNNY